MTTPDNPGTFADMCGSLPSHDAEVMTGARFTPSIAEQDRTHGAGLPAEDRGPDTGPKKYGGSI